MAKNTIKLKKYLDVIEEYQASGTITPGMLLEYDSSGKVKAHSAAGQPAVTLFALEDELQGNGVDDNYSANDQVQVWVAQRGEQVYGILANGENVSIGDYLESNGAGYLQKYAADSAGAVEYPNSIVGQALEAVDISDSSGAESSTVLGYNKRIEIRVV